MHIGVGLLQNNFVINFYSKRDIYLIIKLIFFLEIPYYGLVSSIGADKTSMFLYVRTKGQVRLI